MRLLSGKFHLLTLLLLLVALLSEAQHNGTIFGKIIDNKTAQPVPFATVFLSGTSIGTQSGEDGSFMLNPVPKGKYDLTISCLGYQLTSIQIAFDGADRKLNIRLLPQAKVLKEIEFKVKASAYRRYRSEFKRTFLGQTFNSGKCTIINLDDVDFGYDEEGRVLTASCDKPIIVENRAIGYRMYYLMSMFKLDYRTGYYSVSGIPRFEPLRTKKSGELKSWLKQRDRSYNGSMNHFMVSLKYSCLAENNFSIFLLEKNHGQGPAGGEWEKLGDTLFRVKRITEAELFARRKNERLLLKIIYAGETQEPNYYRNHSHEDAGRANRLVVQALPQTSYIKFTRHELVIYENGYYEDPLTFLIYGYMAWERMADLLPAEYRPGAVIGNSFVSEPGQRKASNVNENPESAQLSIDSVMARRSANGLNVLSGKVTDDRNKPIVSATVFFDNTLISSVAHADGSYQLSNVPSGKYDLVVGAPGYKTIKSSLVLTGSEIVQNWIMEKNPDPIINADEQKKQYDKTLKTYFSGESSDSRRCIIKNVGDVYFSFDKEKRILMGYANKPIVVENLTLGYKVTCFLDEFVFDYSSNSCRTDGTYRMEEMTASSPAELKKWKHERLKSWRGSFSNFMYAVGQKELKKSGFEVFRKTDNGEIPLDENWLFSDRADQQISLRVISRNGIQDFVFPTMEEMDEFNTSRLMVSKATLITWPNGYLEPDYVYEMTGYFRWCESISQLLPREYNPDD